MRNRFLLGMMALSLIGMTSCKDEIDQFDDHGSSTIVSFAGTEKAYMGDSITFDFEVKSGGVKINQAKVQLYYGEQCEAHSATLLFFRDTVLQKERTIHSNQPCQQGILWQSPVELR